MKPKQRSLENEVFKKIDEQEIELTKAFSIKSRQIHYSLNSLSPEFQRSNSSCK